MLIILTVNMILLTREGFSYVYRRPDLRRFEWNLVREWIYVYNNWNRKYSRKKPVNEEWNDCEVRNNCSVAGRREVAHASAVECAIQYQPERGGKDKKSLLSKFRRMIALEIWIILCKLFKLITYACRDTMADH